MYTICDQKIASAMISSFIGNGEYVASCLPKVEISLSRLLIKQASSVADRNM